MSETDREIADAQKSIAEQAKRQADEIADANTRMGEEERLRASEVRRQFEYCTRRDALNASVNFLNRSPADERKVITVAEAFLTWMMMICRE